MFNNLKGNGIEKSYIFFVTGIIQMSLRNLAQMTPKLIELQVNINDSSISANHNLLIINISTDIDVWTEGFFSNIPVATYLNLQLRLVEWTLMAFLYSLNGEVLCFSFLKLITRFRIKKSLFNFELGSNTMCRRKILKKSLWSRKSCTF